MANDDEGHQGPVAPRRCVACREPIEPDARVCPHCRSPQRRGSWQVVGSVLKWAGGASVTITLLLTAIQLNSYFGTWRETRDAVNELVLAADLQRQSGDYPGAWSFLDHALKLEPGSNQARKSQVDLAAEWLRNLRYDLKGRYMQSIETMLPALYRGVASADKTRRADLMAHIGWADVWRTRAVVLDSTFRNDAKPKNVDGHFQRAIEHDPDNPYANAMWGYWMLAGRKHVADVRPFHNVERAEQHFVAALRSGRERPYVQDLRLRALMTSSKRHQERHQGRVRAIKLAIEMRRNEEEIPPNARNKLRGVFRQFAAEESPAQGLFGALLETLPPDQLLATWRWLSQGDVTQSASDVHHGNMIVAIVAELTGDIDKALSLYADVAKTYQRGGKLLIAKRAQEHMDRLRRQSPVD